MPNYNTNLRPFYCWKAHIVLCVGEELLLALSGGEAQPSTKLFVTMLNILKAKAAYGEVVKWSYLSSATLSMIVILLQLGSPTPTDFLIFLKNMPEIPRALQGSFILINH